MTAAEADRCCARRLTNPVNRDAAHHARAEYDKISDLVREEVTFAPDGLQRLPYHRRMKKKSPARPCTKGRTPEDRGRIPTASGAARNIGKSSRVIRRRAPRRPSHQLWDSAFRHKKVLMCMLRFPITEFVRPSVRQPRSPLSSTRGGACRQDWMSFGQDFFQFSLNSSYSVVGNKLQ